MKCLTCGIIYGYSSLYYFGKNKGHPTKVAICADCYNNGRYYEYLDLNELEW